MKNTLQKSIFCHNLHHIITFSTHFNLFSIAIKKSTILAYICMHTDSVLPWKTRLMDLTLIHKQSENGKVIMISSHESAIRMTPQHPIPSPSLPSTNYGNNSLYSQKFMLKYTTLETILMTGNCNCKDNWKKKTLFYNVDELYII